MCIVEQLTQDGPDLTYDVIIGDDEREHILILDDEDHITMLPEFYKQNSKLFCRHPDKDNEWHEMTPNPGEVLHCPANTVLKFVK